MQVLFDFEAARPAVCCYVYAPLLRGGMAAGIPEGTR
jgi:hypothetical protein